MQTSTLNWTQQQRREKQLQIIFHIDVGAYTKLQ